MDTEWVNVRANANLQVDKKTDYSNIVLTQSIMGTVVTIKIHRPT